jgi:hypothetical protein
VVAAEMQQEFDMAGKANVRTTHIPWWIWLITAVVVVAALLELCGLTLVGVKYLPRGKAPAAVVQPTAAPIIVQVVMPTAVVQPTQPAVVQPTAAPTEVVLPTAVPAVVQPTAVPPTAVPPTPAPAEGQADVRAQVATFSNNGWDVVTYEGVTDQITGWFKQLKAPDNHWSETPNMDSPSHGFKAANGTYWYAGENQYCQQDQRCDLNAPSRSIRVVTGDYNIQGIGQCKADKDRQGCAFIWVNVGEVTAMFRNVSIDYGWTESGPYWNGDAMDQTLWAVSSFVSYDMLNVAGGTDVGGNCSVADGCLGVHTRIIVTSGNQLLVNATIAVTK